ncbi:MAG: adenylate/guanylate cyclase domain-containing protein, partial [Pseudomonadota bacterium]|nr:adenylate/guanylate cyclase domain-containing protein [Pseudomonadota bacterium]
GRHAGHVYGVELHGYIISQLLRFALDPQARVIRSWAEGAEVAWIWLWCMAGGVAGLGGLALLRFLAVMAAAALLLGAVCHLALVQGWWLPLVPPGLGLLGAAALVKAYVAAHERAEKRLLMHLFARHVSPEVAQTLWAARQQFLEGRRLRSQRLTATVLFTDIRGFTGISENMDPQALMDWLNVYMEAMSEVITGRGGVINKYIGDAIMAIFGVPIARTTDEEIAADARNAVDCALAMGEALERLNAHWQAQGLPQIGMRVGIHTGPLVAGSLGGEQHLEYTVIGDTVNTASRLESFDKSYADPEVAGGACRILIGETTCRLLGTQFRTKPVARVALRGRKEPLSVYGVVGRTEADRRLEN